MGCRLVDDDAEEEEEEEEGAEAGSSRLISLNKP